MSKFNVGDKVVVREDLEIGKRYDLCRFVNSMARYKGKEVVITHIWIESGGKIRYNINDDNGVFIWSGKMFRVDKKENNEAEAFLDLCSKEVIETMYAALKNSCNEKQIERGKLLTKIDCLITKDNKMEKEIKKLEEAKKILNKRLEELNGGK